MRFEVQFRNTEPTEALIRRAQRKFEKVVKHLREPVEGHLVLTVERHRHRAEINVTSGRDTLKVQEETDDMYATVDRLMHTLERTARRLKERQQDRWASQPGQVVDGFTLAQALAEIEEEGTGEFETTEEEPE
ncbi:MAG: ribosome-associated translation inhibitor RaiA [Deltaproteobacteria bacterium]|nr:ribosome-associated translation inhibitor RaiA [Deltaproteobacteria bacterium]